MATKKVSSATVAFSDGLIEWWAFSKFKYLKWQLQRREIHIISNFIMSLALRRVPSNKNHNSTVSPCQIRPQAMNSKNGGTPQQSATTVFMLLMVSALLPVLLLWYAQGTTQQDRERVEDDQQLAALVERVARILVERVARIALRTIRINREQSGGCGDNEVPRRKKPQLSLYSYKWARLATENDYFLPRPLFDDRQFERIFCLTKSIVKLLIQICGKAGPFFTNIQDVTGRYNISPMAKVLVAIKQLTYGCSPSAFIDYFRMSTNLARQSKIKFCIIVTLDDN